MSQNPEKYNHPEDRLTRIEKLLVEFSSSISPRIATMWKQYLKLVALEGAENEQYAHTQMMSLIEAMYDYAVSVYEKGWLVYKNEHSGSAEANLWFELFTWYCDVMKQHSPIHLQEHENLQIVFEEILNYLAATFKQDNPEIWQDIFQDDIFEVRKPGFMAVYQLSLLANPIVLNLN